MSKPLLFLRRPAVASILPKPVGRRTIISSVRASASAPVSSYNAPNRSEPQSLRQWHARPSQTCVRNRQSASPIASSSTRNYHSASHPPPDPPADSYTPEQSAILSSALKHVPEHGFSNESLLMGVREAGYLDVSLQLFPRGAELELVMYWLASRRGFLKQKVESGEIFGSKLDATTPSSRAEVDERVKILIMERLRMNGEVIHHWQDALAIMSLPSSISRSLGELYQLSSDILYLANDRSVDASWYSRRLSVATVYASAEINMTEDTSPNFSSTMEFVERRIHDANAVTDTLSDAKRYLGYVAGSIVGAGRSLGMKV